MIRRGHMLQSDDPIDDVIVRARRGDVPESDERRLREVLAGASIERELYEAGRAFDAEAPVQSDDAERIDRLVDEVERRLRPARQPRMRALTARVLAAA